MMWSDAKEAYEEGNKDGYEEAVYDIWRMFLYRRDHVDCDFWLGRRSISNAVQTRDEAQKAIDLIEAEYPELFKEE